MAVARSVGYISLELLLVHNPLAYEPGARVAALVSGGCTDQKMSFRRG